MKMKSEKQPPPLKNNLIKGRHEKVNSTCNEKNTNFRSTVEKVVIC